MNLNKESLKNFYLKYRILIFPVVVGISSLVLIALVIFPQASKLISNNEALNGVREKTKKLEVKAVALENLDEDALSQNVNLSLSVLPSDKNLADAVGLIQSVVTESGFTLLTISIGSGNDDQARVKGFSVKVEAEAPQSLLSGLLTDLESSSRVMKVSSVDLNRLRNSQVASVVLTVNVYYQDVPASLGSTDAPLPTLAQSEEELLNKLVRTVNTSSSVQPNSVDITSILRGKSNPFE